MTDRELLQMALDALDIACRKYGEVGNINTDWGQWDSAMTALRARLAQPEPVIYARKEGDLIVVDLPQVPTGGGGISKREWVGLTEAEIDATVKSCNTTDTYKYFRAIEAKLKEKNNG